MGQLEREKWKRNSNGWILSESAVVAALAQNTKLSVTIFTATNEKTKCVCCLKHSAESWWNKLLFLSHTHSSVTRSPSACPHSTKGVRVRFLALTGEGQFHTRRLALPCRDNRKPHLLISFMYLKISKLNFSIIIARL